MSWRAGNGRLSVRLRLRRLGHRVRRVATGTGMAALAVPLAWPAGAGGQHLGFPSAGSVRSGVVRLADFVSGQSSPAPAVPAQPTGTAPAHPGQVPASVTRAVARAQGTAPFSVPGVVPAYAVRTPSLKEVTTGPEAGGAGSDFNAATSTLVQSGTNATTDLYENADGTYTERVYASPVNARTSAGAWGPSSTATGAGAGANGMSAAGSGAGAGPLPVGFNGSARSMAVLGLTGAGLAGVPAGFHVTAASLNLFDVAASQCSTQSTVSVHAVTGAVAAGSAASYSGSAAPATGAELGSWAGTAPSAACAGSGGWISVPFNSAGLSVLGSAGAKGVGLAVEAPASDEGGWKEFAGLPGTAAGSAPSAAPSPSAPPASPSPASPPSPVSSSASPSPAQPSPAATSPAASPSATGPAPVTASPAASASLDAYIASAASPAGAQAPFVDVTLAATAPPQISSQYPPDNDNEPTLTPELVATGTEPSGAPDALTYSFAVYSSTGTEVASASSLSSGDWAVPAGKLSWNQAYYWTVADYDGQASSTTKTISYFSTPVPQPLVTSQLSQNPAGPGFDPTTGDWTTSATDAQVATVGPALEITRDYNSADPRRSGAFGASWSSVLDMQVAAGGPNASGTTQTEVVTYPDGEDVAFGLNSGGTTYSPPPGRYATLTPASGGFTLTDKNDTVYSFTQQLSSGAYGITSITDASERAETFAWNGTGQITQVTSASGRTLNLTWTQPANASYSHVGSVVTNDATTGNSSTAQDWTYDYSGDELTAACPPASTTACTAYGYTSGSDYQNAVLDSGPHAYWRLDEPSGSGTAGDSMLVNEGADNASYTGVTLGQDQGPLPGSSATAASFNGSSSYVTLKQGLVSGASYQTVSLWFKTSTPDGVLFSYQASPITAGSTTSSWVPAIYVGSDGKLKAEYWNGKAAPMTSSSPVDDGQWHLVTLTAAGNTQTLYLDGAQVGSPLAGTVDVAGMTNNYVGAGYNGDAWPDEKYDVSGTAYPEYFTGDISDVAFWSRQLTLSQAQALYTDGTNPAALLTKVTKPSGGVYAQVAYAPLTGRVTSDTDSNGGAWGIAAPTVQGSSQVYVASVLGAFPGDYYRLADAGTTTATNQLIGGTATYNDVTQGVTSGSLFADEPVDSFNGSSSYLAMPQGLTAEDGVESVGLWFKTAKAGGSLFSVSADPLAATTTGDYSGGLYVGSDGKLVGAFFDGNAASVVESGGAVDDGKWHFAVLAADATGQALYLDGSRVGTLSAGLDSGDQEYAYVGAGFIGGGWPDESHNDPGSDTGYASYFTGDIAEVAWYHAALSATSVDAEYSASKYSTGLTPVQTDTVTDPGGLTLSYQYDPLNGDRVVSQTDGDGNTTAYGYSTTGFQDRVVNPDGDITDYGYDVRGNLVDEQTCQNQVTGVCSTSRRTYYPDDTTADPPADPRNDELMTYWDPRTGDDTSSTAYETTYAYDSAGDQTGVTTPAGHGVPVGADHQLRLHRRQHQRRRLRGGGAAQGAALPGDDAGQRGHHHAVRRGR
ncbi:MAG: LamG-like jellyroll fold domain-containing protein [Trebonia sp.]